MAGIKARVNELEKVVQPESERIVVYYDDIQPGEQKPDEGQIEVNVSYYDDRKPEVMTMREYKDRFPDWQNDLIIHVVYEDGMVEEKSS